ncbi:MULTISPECIES: response regulator transcription factor [unclassified Meiothermus]|uniref:response regulator transcription factor n=1 Tax=unclassified Meiothermus TaxID=370471 RepID=UPI000D7C4E70|nr:MULTISPECIES: response regulator transcription factor [unclassified Meiothermus]PZA06627.1 DNA-binding response regulator [Meiothermus sp. Pnk-1]RYM37730.1 response regulator transcription factor [Meiothermus sp. PNK-Is4]
MIRIVLADDHALFRQGLRSLLEAEPDFRVVGEAGDGREALRHVLEAKPDVVLMDIQMPGLDGVQATREILREWPQAKVIMLTMYRQDAYVFEAVKAGARGYMLKDADAKDLLEAIRRVNHGEVLLDAELAEQIIQDFKAKRESVPKPHAELSEREVQILKLVAQGYTNLEIAGELALSEKTVRNRLSEIFQKLHLNNRTQAALYALREGLAEPGEGE